MCVQQQRGARLAAATCGRSAHAPRSEGRAPSSAPTEKLRRAASLALRLCTCPARRCQARPACPTAHNRRLRCNWQQQRRRQQGVAGCILPFSGGGSMGRAASGQAARWNCCRMSRRHRRVRARQSAQGQQLPIKCGPSSTQSLSLGQVRLLRNPLSCQSPQARAAPSCCNPTQTRSQCL